jgi:alpha-L-fucosidase
MIRPNCHRVLALTLQWLPLALSAGANAEEPAFLKPQPEAVAKWRDMRFGMFIHWGPVSLTGQEIGWSRGRQTPVQKYDSLILASRLFSATC